MTMTEEIERLLQPIDSAEPAGPNLEYDAQFQALEEAARPRPERALGAGVIASEQPSWRQVAEQATALLLRAKDLRVAAHLCTARLHLDGFAGWADGLNLLSLLLERYWDAVHPRLDADADPIERVNALASLVDHATLHTVRSTRLLQGLHPAHFSLRDLRLAQGVQREADGVDEERPGLGAIDTCLRETPLQALVDLDATLLRAEEALAAIARLFNERTPGSGPALDPALRDLRELRAFLAAYLLERNASMEQSPADAASDGERAVDVARAANGAIERREDVMRALQQLCDYYARREPSSPVPLLLRRAQRLVGLDFAALLRDLAPGGIAELRVISGDPHDA
ncbi:type VI secretion system protein TssA [Xanthomonas cerealis pv. cerealis]|uniref:type VI secretion system protein TssA n=1 Tax=Xanthomonas translucens group TaxID=3390202 RepID=UPI00071BF8F9|nr:type VI secretion system protein TssA [Xanthomonas translucens]UKE68437.1 type VI secretion system protein TssA [Xanthomonas translucens pv. pistacia]